MPVGARRPGFLLEIENELPDMYLVQPVHTGGQPVLLKKDAELFQERGVPLDGLRAFPFGLAGDSEPLGEILQI